MPAAALLSIAIALEVAATLLLRVSDGFSKLGPSILVISGYALSTALLAKIVKDLDVGRTLSGGAFTSSVVPSGVRRTRTQRPPSRGRPSTQ